MKVAVIINSKAGRAGELRLEERIREALFRCDLSFGHPQTIDELDVFLDMNLADADYLLICGGDGTVSVTLQRLMKKKAAGLEIPPIGLVSSGTANDLATKIGMSPRIETAARALMHEKVKKIDVIELISDCGKVAYMVTNGGIGIPAEAANAVNNVKSTLRSLVESSRNGVVKTMAEHTHSFVQKLGPRIYTVMAAEALRTWSPRDWELEIELPGGETLVTRAPSVLISNQKNLGQSMETAPFTNNMDGLVNLLVSEALNLKDQVRTMLSLRRGNPDQIGFNKIYEVPEFRLTSRNPQRPLTFFGDGEILLKDVQGITVRCHKQSLPIVFQH